MPEDLERLLNFDDEDEPAEYDLQDDFVAAAADSDDEGFDLQKHMAQLFAKAAKEDADAAARRPARRVAFDSDSDSTDDGTDSEAEEDEVVPQGMLDEEVLAVSLTQ